MIKEDYIMRLIKEMVRTILKLVFDIDIATPDIELLQDEEEKNRLTALQRLIDNGEINEAENQLFEILSQKSMIHLEMGLIFYSYLNDKTDDFLEEYDFDREEIETGIRDLISEYGLDSMADAFISK